MTPLKFSPAEGWSGQTSASQPEEAGPGLNFWTLFLLLITFFFQSTLLHLLIFMFSFDAYIRSAQSSFRFFHMPKLK